MGVSLVAFFFEYARLPANGDLPLMFYNRRTGGGADVAAFGIMSVVIVTAILMTAVLVSSRRWSLPKGSVTFLFVAVQLFIAIGFDGDMVGLVPLLLAGLFADTLIANRRCHRWVLAGGTPLVLWSTFFVIVGGDPRGLQWPPTIWGGAIFFGVLTGLALNLLLNAGEQPAIAPTNRRDSPAETSPAGP